MGICITKLFGIALACSLYIKLKRLHVQHHTPNPVNFFSCDRRTSIYELYQSDDDEHQLGRTSIINQNAHNLEFSKNKIETPSSIYDRRI